MSIETVARTEVVAVDIEATPAEIAGVIRDEGVSSVVVDGTGSVAGILTDDDLVGIVTLDDLLVHLGEEFDCLTSVVRRGFPA
jgi:CBS domain-containing protein